MSSTASPHVERLSMRVALGATGLVTALYLVIAVVIVVWMTVSLTAQVDTRLQRSLAVAVEGNGRGTGDTKPGSPDSVVGQAGDPTIGGPFGRERVVWRIAGDGTVESTREDLVLPTELATVTDPLTVTIAGAEIRIMGGAGDGEYLVVGESMDPVNDARTTVMLGLLIIAPFLLVGVFVGALAVGRRVAMPIERARQRQLAFTADASHELRTPLAVIEASASLALANDRDAAWYRGAFVRVSDESQRMRGLIEDLLWLARFDATEKPSQHEPVDLGVLAEQATERFVPIADAKSLSLQVRFEDPDTSLSVPPEWIDRLISVLLDNSCKYTPANGRVVVGVARVGGRPVLSVDDSGPGIPSDQREVIFDRFRRGTSASGGSGLGLAIADSIVEATSGSWSIDTSPLGGARMSVGWPSSPDPRDAARA